MRQVGLNTFKRIAPASDAISAIVSTPQPFAFNSERIIAKGFFIANRYRKLVPILLDA
jgi:hypothetical protein